METRRRNWIRLTLWVGLAGAALLLWFQYTRSIRLLDPEQAPAATALVLRDPGGAELSLASYRGKVVLLNLWAAWCGPCRREIPRLNRLDRDFRDRGLVVLGINVESRPPAGIPELARDLGIDYRVVVPGGPLEGTFHGEGVLPQTWMVDREGRVRGSHGGEVSEESLRRACETLLGEPTP